MGKVTNELLDEIQDAFNRHDVDAIVSFFADDCEWLMARGPDPWEGKRLIGKQAISDVLRSRYKVIEDMRWEDMTHFISPDGTKACSEWTVISPDGTKACSEWTVRGTPNDGSPRLISLVAMSGRFATARSSKRTPIGNSSVRDWPPAPERLSVPSAGKFLHDRLTPTVLLII